MTYLRKPLAGEHANPWGPWAAVRFHTEGARDEFLSSVALTEDSGWGAQPMSHDPLGAQVRWRPGRFLRLNDVAYAHGGRIVFRLKQHRIF